MNKNEYHSQKFKCPTCSSILHLSLINENEMIYLCSNKYCLYPLDSENMKAFIFNKENSYQAIQEIITLMNKENSINTTNSDPPSNFYFDFPDNGTDIDISPFLD